MSELLICSCYIGTSGRPKGVAISHSAFIIQSLAKIAIVGYGEDDVCMCSFRSLQLVKDVQIRVSQESGVEFGLAQETE